MKTIAIFSGGMDSTTLLYDLLGQGDEVKALSFNYGQRHNKELEFARRTTSKLGIEHKVVDITSINELLQGSALTTPGVAVPHGHYAAENMKETVVPNRNMIMSSLAAGYAISQKYDRIAFGAHGGDHDIYPDCRQSFVDAMNRALEQADWHKVNLHAPYLSMRKEDIASRGHELNVPWEDTWSCYEGNEYHCGECGTCVERIEAFNLAGVKDNTLYSDSPTLFE